MGMTKYRSSRNNEGEAVNPFYAHGIISNEYKRFGVEKDVFYLDQISLDAYEKMKRMFQQHDSEIKNVLIKEMQEELIDKLTARGYSWADIDMFFSRMDEKTFRETVSTPVYEHVYSSLPVPFFERSAHSTRDYASFNLGALAIMRGKGESKEKNTYWHWPMRESILRRSENEAPYLYLTGPPGTGKSNAIDLSCLTGLNMNYPVYTTRPLLPRSSKDHLYRFSRLSDLFTDTREIPSIFRSIKWLDDNGINGGVMLATDERGAGELSTNIAGRCGIELGQIRRHFKLTIVEGGVRQKPPALEKDVTVLVRTHRETLKETDREGNPKMKFSWEVMFREPIEDEKGDETKHIHVYDIPKCNLSSLSKNKFDLTPDFNIDISIRKMVLSLGDTAKLTADELLEQCRDFARNERDED